MAHSVAKWPRRSESGAAVVPWSGLCAPALGGPKGAVTPLNEFVFLRQRLPIYAILAILELRPLVEFNSWAHQSSTSRAAPWHFHGSCPRQFAPTPNTLPLHAPRLALGPRCEADDLRPPVRQGVYCACVPEQRTQVDPTLFPPFFSNAAECMMSFGVSRAAVIFSLPVPDLP